MIMIINIYINKLNVFIFYSFYFFNKKYIYFCSHKKGISTTKSLLVGIVVMTL
jgi:hypothetical protein